MLAPSLSVFLRSTEAVDCHHPAVWTRAVRLGSSRSGSIEKAQAVFEFVRDEIPFSPAVAYPASAVLEQREGICVAKALLFVALCRALGIPAGFSFQGIRGQRSGEPYVMHGLGAAYLEGRWVRLDSRGGTHREVCFDAVNGSLLPPEDFSIVQYPGVYSDLPEEFRVALRQSAWQNEWPDALLTPPDLQAEW